MDRLAAEVLERLAGLALSGASLNAVLDKLAHIGCDTIPGAAAVTITLGTLEGRESVGTGRHHKASLLRPLGLDHLRPTRLVTRTTRAV